MPPRSTRHAKKAATAAARAQQLLEEQEASPAPSPPTQLPTPLPEESPARGGEGEGEVVEWGEAMEERLEVPQRWGRRRPASPSPLSSPTGLSPVALSSPDPLPHPILSRDDDEQHHTALALSSSQEPTPGTLLPHLIDFGDYPSSSSQDAYSSQAAYHEEEETPAAGAEDRGVYTSPAFREAQLVEEDEDVGGMMGGGGAPATRIEEPTPLPVPVPIRMGMGGMGMMGMERTDSGSSSTGSGSGHVRTPVLTRPPSTFESLSRTLKTYVPSSIHIPVPTAAPSPPLVSRPVSFGSFSGSKHEQQQRPPSHQQQHTYRDPYTLQHQQSPPPPFAHQEDTVYSYGYGYGHGSSPVAPQPRVPNVMRSEPAASGLAQAMGGMWSGRAGSRSGLTSGANHRQGEREGVGVYSRSEPAPDVIRWAQWDTLGTRRLLIIAYAAGLQIWDCADLGSVSEILNLDLTLREWELLGIGTRVVHAAILPSPKLRKGVVDPWAVDRPLLGIIVETEDENPTSTFVIYSLNRHHVVKSLPISGSAETFIANDNYIVISSLTPLLLILSSHTFHTLSTITANSLLCYTTPSHQTKKSLSIPSSSQLNNNITVLLRDPTHGMLLESTAHPADRRRSPSQHSEFQPRPVFALSHRLLAYASPAGGETFDSRRISISSASSGPSSSVSSSPFGLGKVTQADIGNAALKVGGSVLSGMMYLGGKAFEAAKSQVAGGGGAADAAAGSRFFSRSAPAGGDVGQPLQADPNADKGRRRYSNVSSFTPWGASPKAAALPQLSGNEHHPTLSPKTATTRDSGYYITVVDLARISGGVPTKVAEFRAYRDQPIAKLRFSSDGCSLLAVPGDGQTVKVFNLKPMPWATREACLSEESTTGKGEDSADVETQATHGSVWHMYNLHRGRTSAVVEEVEWTADGRWIAIGTRNRTVHVFPVNPYGGIPDIRSHIDGKVRNAPEFPTLPATVSPLIRLRAAKTLDNRQTVPLTITFVDPSDIHLPNSLLPSKPPSRALDPAGSPPLSSQRPLQPTNYQDILIFDASDGVLSLRRFSIDVRTKDPGLSSMVGGKSISLPGMGGSGRLSTSPSTATSRTSALTMSKLTQMMDTTQEMFARETSVVATWNVQRRTDWVETKLPLAQPEEEQQGVLSTRWLALAELSTCTRSQKLLPRSIYISHQFSFFTLGEDYHALIRRYRLDISGSKIEVRREVQISAHPVDIGGESFVEGSSPRDIRRVASSFEEPLASALAGGFDSSNPSAVIPMFPNGTPGSHPKSFRNSIPIRTMAGIGDGMSESLGRIRREIHKARSPTLSAYPDSMMSGPVPLEFDEEDEDFLSRNTLDVPCHGRDDSSRERASADFGPSIPTPDSTSRDEALLGGTDDDYWGGGGWDPEDSQAVEEAERFDDISVVGFLDEEQTTMMEAAAQKQIRKGRTRRRNL